MPEDPEPAAVGYITEEDVRAEGLTSETAFTTEKIEKAIARWSAFVDRACRQWFEPREYTMLLDGDETDTLFLPVPVISVTGLYMNTYFEAPVAPDLYCVYNGRGDPIDDRPCPKICIQHDGSIFGGRGLGGFYRGTKNQKVEGVFGYTESDGSTPLLIQQAVMKLVIRELTTPLYRAPGSVGGGGGGAGGGGPKVSETTDRHSISYAMPSGLRIGTMAVTGDAAIDKVLEMYKGPIAIAVA